MHKQRGAALPETALVLTILLAIVVGAVRVALVGYQQISVDGAAFFNAHETGIKQTYPGVAGNLDPTAATQGAFPNTQSPNSQISPVTVAPPSVTLPNYGFDVTTNRHGGASLIQPSQTISTVTRSQLDPINVFGGSLLTVTGIGVEPSFQETGVHGDIGGTDFGTAASFANATDYFSEGENTPPYFGGFHYIHMCPMTPDPTQSWNSCPVPVVFLALGLGEYLDQDNWGRSIDGTSPEGTAVFWETLYHEDVFAGISGLLPSTIADPRSCYPVPTSPPALVAACANTQAAQKFLNRTDSTQLVYKVYSWDSTQQGGFPQAGYTPGQYPLTPGAGYP